MDIQVWGSKGMLGQAVMRAASAAGHTVLEGVGILEKVGTRQILAETIINCAGMTKQRELPAYLVVSANSVGPHRLARIADLMGARVIHMSTDCVFEWGGPHDETTIPDAADMYALAKRAGELLTGPHLTVRSSFVGFGSRGLLHDLTTRDRVTVSQNLLWSGHTVDVVALTLVWMAEHPHVTGLLHMPGTFQSRYTLARDLKARWDCKAVLERDDSFVADRRLTSGKWAYLGCPTLPPFEEQLETMWGPT